MSVKGFVSLIKMNVALATINFLIGAILARALGPELRGQYFIIAMAISVAAQLSISGVHLLLAREAGCLNISSKSLHYLAYKIVLYLFVPGILLFGLISYILSLNQSNNLPILIWIIAGVAIPFSQLNAIQLQIEIGRKILNTYSKILITVAIVQGTIAVILYLIGNRNLYFYITILLAGSLAGVISSGILSARYPTGSIKTNLLNKSINELVLLGKRDSVGVIVNLAVTIVDKIVVGLYFSSAFLGIYVVASSISHLQSLIAESAAPLFFVKSNASEKNNLYNDNLAKANQLRKLILLNLIVLVILLIIAPWLLPAVFGNQYIGGQILVAILLPGIAARAAMRPFQELMRANNMTLQESLITLFSFSIFLILSSIAITYDSLIGIAFAQTFCAIFAFVMIIIISSRLLGVAIISIIQPKLKDIVEMYNSIKKIIF